MNTSILKKSTALLVLSLAACTLPKGAENTAPLQAKTPAESLADYKAQRGLASVPSSPNDLVQTEYLKQGWDDRSRQIYYYTPQGSSLMPYAWARAMENADDQSAFLSSENLAARFGYIPQAKTASNPDGLPVGFTKDGTSGKPALGMNCAACHTSEVYYKGRAIRIDGGAAANDFQKFVWSMDQAIFATANDQAKFQRFAERLYGAAPGADEKRAQLKGELGSLVKERREWQARNSTPMHYGMGRNDAFGVIFNQVLDRDLGMPENRREPNAPVSYPVMWDAHQSDIVQWIGIARTNLEEKGPLSRNIGQVLGVFGHSDLGKQTLLLHGYCSSARRTNLDLLEAQMKTLWSPEWPEEILGSIDKVRAQAGRKLFQANCIGCHSDINRADPARIVRSKMIPIKQILTDAKVASNAAFRTAKTGPLMGRKTLVAKGRPMKETEPAGNVLRHVVAGSLVGTISPITCGADADSRIEGGRAFVRGWTNVAKASVDKILTKQQQETDAPPEVLMAYKARPLNGAWASGPFLHNGAVKNLYEMLLPASQRSTKFTTGCQQVDPKYVGFECASGAPNTSEFDTTIDGNSNSGHEIATELTEDERMSLVEYMKTL